MTCPPALVRSVCLCWLAVMQTDCGIASVSRLRQQRTSRRCSAGRKALWKSAMIYCLLDAALAGAMRLTNGCAAKKRMLHCSLLNDGVLIYYRRKARPSCLGRLGWAVTLPRVSSGMLRRHNAPQSSFPLAVVYSFDYSFALCLLPHSSSYY